MPFVDQNHQHFVTDVLEDGSHTPITPGGATPTLAEVLAVGNTTGGLAITGDTADAALLAPALNLPGFLDVGSSADLAGSSDDNGTTRAGRVILSGADTVAKAGGTASLMGGNAPSGTGGNVVITAGTGATAGDTMVTGGAGGTGSAGAQIVAHGADRIGAGIAGSVEVLGGVGTGAGGSFTATGGHPDPNANNSIGGMLYAGPADVNGGIADVWGGTSTDGRGGHVDIKAGRSSNAIGGSVTVTVGTGGSANGNLLLVNIPTADPHVANAVWSNAGVLTRSAG
jgi:hypothetical protein